jgi:hypothetical protein
MKKEIKYTLEQVDAYEKQMLAEWKEAKKVSDADFARCKKSILATCKRWRADYHAQKI